jgi:hypothetical protein
MSVDALKRRYQNHYPNNNRAPAAAAAAVADAVAAAEAVRHLECVDERFAPFVFVMT